MRHGGARGRAKVEYLGAWLHPDGVDASKNGSSQLGAERIPHAVLDFGLHLAFAFLDGDSLFTIYSIPRYEVSGHQDVLLTASHKHPLVAMRLDDDFRCAPLALAAFSFALAFALAFTAAFAFALAIAFALSRVAFSFPFAIAFPLPFARRATATQPEHKVERRLFLDVVVGESAAILQLLPGKDEALLVGRDALFILNLCFDVVDRIRRLHLKGDSLSRQSLHKNLHLNNTRG
mmetsp:Transcript_3429/g.8266  ORF Transcript_3429/g.8266 Transcript_3429/m.8266 type:complete len:234 (-) Transcript_3429:362-1063(-)